MRERADLDFVHDVSKAAWLAACSTYIAAEYVANPSSKNASSAVAGLTRHRHHWCEISCASRRSLTGLENPAKQWPPPRRGIAAHRSVVDFDDREVARGKGAKLIRKKTTGSWPRSLRNSRRDSHGRL